MDDVDAAQHELGLVDRAASRARHPNDVEPDDLDWADLVLMDFMIEHWPEREEDEQVSLRPPNGLALSGVLREHADSQNGDDHDYTAFAIHTGKVEKLSRRLHTSNKAAHVVARLNNLEWVFDKSDDSRFVRSAELAAAVRIISNSWKKVEDGGVEAALQRLLGLRENTPWHSRAFDDVVLCQVPLSEFSAGTNGLLFLRWLLHSILPYPTFLWAEQWVAARLRITPSALRGVLGGDSPLATDLKACCYGGILKDFLGPRWWRAGIEQYAWGEGLRPDDVTPPFLALCKVAISHLKNSCDREHAIYLTAAPTPWVSGSITADKVPTAIGAGTVWVLPEGAEVGMLEFQGAGVTAQKALMDEKIDTMATLGARMLSVTMNRNETIDTATQRTRSELALLHGVVVSVETAINRLLRVAAEWVGTDADEASVSLSRDFIETSMDPKMIESQMNLWQSGGISRATLYENLQSRRLRGRQTTRRLSSSQAPRPFHPSLRPW